MDIRHEEFVAMTDVYLGTDFNQDMLRAVEQVQIQMQEDQTKLVAEFDQKRLTPEQYVDACNMLVQSNARVCELILGPEHFKMLFGIEAGETRDFIDKAAFLAVHGATQSQDYSSHAYSAQNIKHVYS